ncbi:hypothetical protein LTR66_011362 [Elasticomyces elasticus]|nr:hypothetical protein LTR66_011362 [Elasticomyces elasticus]
MAPESLRERELYRYYQPWLDARGDLFNVKSDPSAQGLTYTGYQPKASADKALTAFAQLAALRLGVKRGIVSLIDANKQYVLAEATKTVSLASEQRHQADDELWLGNTIIARKDSISVYTFDSTYTANDTDGNTCTAEALVIDDCRLDERFRDRDYVKAEPGVRFYAGVPIKTRAGHKIGVYAVVSDKPRNGLDIDELSFMIDTAATVMEHLELARDRMDRYTGERMIRGLIDFIEGVSTTDSQTSTTKSETGVRKAVNSQGKSPFHTVPSVGETGPDEKLSNRSRSGSVTNGKKKSKRYSSTSPSSGQDPFKVVSSAAKVEQNTENANEPTGVFMRAARIVRESTFADGVVFFGGDAASMAETSNMSEDSASESDVHSEGSSPGRRRVRRRGSSGCLDPGKPGRDSPKAARSVSAKACEVIGLSVGLSGSGGGTPSLTLSAESLRMCFEKYPKGKIFDFTDQGVSMSSGDESASEVTGAALDSAVSAMSQKDSNGESRIPGRRKRDRFFPVELLKALPEVRSLIFLPMWDFTEGRWVAGGFIWSCTAGRIMRSGHELPYLKAFANTMLSEIARIKAQKADRAKSTFIESISHELRSPLHGILGSVEFLYETANSSHQSGLFTSIETCGKTLLDTIDHLLDYAKINRLKRTHDKKQSRRRNLPVRSSKNISISLAAEVDLGLLVEEVVEAVCAGHSFKKSHPGGFNERDPNKGSHTLSTTASQEDGNASPDSQPVVAVLLDIQPRLSWKVHTQPGALRRVIMNLVGNALKYTSSGFVAVSLRAHEDTDPSKVAVKMRFIDSGKGMSLEFQRTRMFMPFSQEDPFQAGTGLGLSIVRQIVDSLGGTIEVKSIQQVGTEVDVLLTLVAAEYAVDKPEETVLSVAAATKGLKLCLLDPNAKDEPPLNDNVQRLETSLRDVCKGWYEMETIKAHEMRGVEADFFVYAEPPSVDYLLEHHGKSAKDGDGMKEVPLIIVCLDAAEAIRLSGNEVKKLTGLGRIVEVIPQPCGPRKLGKALQHCLRRMAESSGSQPEDKNARVASFLQRQRPDSQEASTAEKESSERAGDVNVEPDVQRIMNESLESVRRRASVEIPPSLAISFPPSSPMEKQSMEKKAKNSGQSPSKSVDDLPHVLVVDDNNINLNLLTMFMKKHKYTYEEAHNGLEALEKYKEASAPHDPTLAPKKRRFDYVLMDISMPVMDGLTSTREIRKFEKENKMTQATIIALTGLANEQTQQEAMNSGINVYLAKPVKFQELRHLLHR